MLVRRRVLAALIAVVAVSIGEAAGWHGVDTAAAVYRVDAYRTSGFQLWDFAWYGGHWTLGYSVIYPPIAATVGIAASAIVSAGIAAWSFDALVGRHFSTGSSVASYLFALGTLVQSAIGQLPFLTGEAFGLAALWALTRRRHLAAVALVLACTLTSPLPGAFAALCAAAWLAAPFVSAPGRAGLAACVERLAPASAVTAVAVAPILAGVVVFPGDGPMPYPVIDWLWEMLIAAVVGLLAGRRYPAVAAGAGMWALVATASVAVASALGGNVGRIEDVAALPLAAGLAWEQPRRAGRLLAAAAAVPFAASEWLPATGAIFSAPGLASTHRAFYEPLDRELAALARTGPPGRVEVVPTEYHWEAAWVAPVVALARGWERQLDTAYNPLFYHPGMLNARTYRQWLLANGVRYVAVPRAPLDFAGAAEATLVSSGAVQGLSATWSNPDWTLYEVKGSPGIVSGPARLVRAAGTSITVDVTGGSPVTLRFRFSPDWDVTAGSGCVSEAPGSWIKLVGAGPGTVTLSLSVWNPGASACRRPAKT